MSEWLETNLKALLKEKGYLRGPFGSALKRGEMKNKGVPVYEQQHAIYNTREFRYFIDESKAEELRRFRTKANDLLISCSGTVGEISIIDENDPEGIISQALLVLRPDLLKVSPNFLYYFFKTRNGHNQLLSASHGSVQVNIAKREVVESIPIKIPSTIVQNRITEILSSLDAKIELNNQINQNLEALAQALFKQWFVDFEFPNESGEPYKSSGGKMIDSELGEIPKGWKVIPLSQIIELKHGYAFKGEFFSDSETDKILVTPGNFKIGGGFNYGKFKFYEGDFPKEYLLNFEDLIVTMTDLSKEGDTLGYPALVPKIRRKKLLHNQRIGKVIFKETPEMKNFLYMLMRTVNYRSFILSGASGTTVRHTSPSRICEFKSVIPPYEILESFREVVAPLFRAEAENNFENNITSNLRDALLPKLISGELEVNESLLESTF
jgi:type I restriction enzyme S subunit